MEAKRKRLLGVELVGGVNRRNAVAALYASFVSLGILNFMHFAQPYLLLDVVGLEQDYIGRFTGYLASWVEFLTMFITVLVGIWADKIGRRALYAAAMVLIAFGYTGMVVVQGQVDFIVYRTVLGIGAAFIGTLMGLTMVDYPWETSRGKWAAMNSVMNGIGVVAVAMGVTKLPAYLESGGYADSVAMQITLAGLVLWALATAVILRTGLITGLNDVTKGNSHETTGKMLRMGLTASGKNPRVLLSYLLFVVSRADMVVLSLYFTLWVQEYARGAGVSPIEAVAKAGMLFALIQVASLLWGPVYGYLLDRFDRLFYTVIALFMAGFGYVALGFIENPLADNVYVVCILVGMGQISVILATQSVIGQEAPVDRRGTVIGIAAFCGTIGIFLTSLVGGLVYDMWMPSAPMVVFGALNLLVMLPALYIWFRYSGSVRPRHRAGDIDAVQHV